METGFSRIFGLWATVFLVKMTGKRGRPFFDVLFRMELFLSILLPLPLDGFSFLFIPAAAAPQGTLLRPWFGHMVHAVAALGGIEVYRRPLRRSLQQQALLLHHWGFWPDLESSP